MGYTAFEEVCCHGLRCISALNKQPALSLGLTSTGASWERGVLLLLLLLLGELQALHVGPQPHHLFLLQGFLLLERQLVCLLLRPPFLSWEEMMDSVS